MTVTVRAPLVFITAATSIPTNEDPTYIKESRWHMPQRTAEGKVKHTTTASTSGLMLDSISALSWRV